MRRERRDILNFAVTSLKTEFKSSEGTFIQLTSFISMGTDGADFNGRYKVTLALYGSSGDGGGLVAH